ncbi:hypothetical protein ZIOFF_043486 [Zingiber officinale]|uniref:Protein kinase domain-containing protein n=1 Tax=Zingiber officinale TaxID=94328 RepID=A0A8J5FVD7_ZINOF|nr:hypothetical protein ZIOFF_043486 [Zingiber officinale]
MEQRVFQYEMLVAATRNFNPKNKLGEGGFSRLQGIVAKIIDELIQKKMSWVLIRVLVDVQHKNMVNLYGYCTHGDDKVLVYEYVPNESLNKLLFSRKPHRH